MISQAEFARLIGVSRAMVSRYRADGRLVIVGEKVDELASLQRLRGTLNEDKRLSALARIGGDPTPPGPISPRVPISGATFETDPLAGNDRARRERIIADLKQIELDERLGRLVSAEEVRKAIEGVVSTFWSELQRRQRDDADTISAVLRLDAEAARVFRAELAKRDAAMRRDFAMALSKMARETAPALRAVG